MNNITYRQDMMGRPGRKVYDMRPRATRDGISAMDYYKFAFGFSISGAVVTVNAGKILHGIRAPWPVHGKAINITEDYTYIYVHYLLNSTSAGEILSSTTEPGITSTTIDYPLHLWRLNAGVAEIADAGILHLGNIILPGNFA